MVPFVRVKILSAMTILFCQASVSWAADCILYADLSRAGASLEPSPDNRSNDDEVIVPNGWNDRVTSVWVRRGHQLVLSEHSRMQGKKIYLYGFGKAYKEGVWFHQDKALADSEGFTFNLIDLGFNDMTSAFSCLSMD